TVINVYLKKQQKGGGKAALYITVHTTELDLNSSGERGDREGEEEEKREVKETNRAEEKKKLTT
ncbi:hypothetical protein FQN60_005050, partial [Etheostoma spectabile]